MDPFDVSHDALCVLEFHAFYAEIDAQRLTYRAEIHVVLNMKFTLGVITLLFQNHTKVKFVIFSFTLT